MNTTLAAFIVISCVTLGACGGGDGTPAAAPNVVAVFVGQELCDVLRPSEECPVPPADGNIHIVFDRLLQGEKLVDLQEDGGGWEQVPLGLEAGAPRLPIALEAGGVSMEGQLAVTYTPGGLVDPDSGADIGGVGPALLVAGIGMELALPHDADVVIHLVPDMVVSRNGGLKYVGPDIRYHTGAVTDAGVD